MPVILEDRRQSYMMHENDRTAWQWGRRHAPQLVPRRKPAGQLGRGVATHYRYSSRWYAKAKVVSKTPA